MLTSKRDKTIVLASFNEKTLLRIAKAMLRRVRVESEGVEPSSRQGTNVLSTCLALFELSGISLVKYAPAKTVAPLSYSAIGTVAKPAQNYDTHCLQLMSGTANRVACPDHLVTGIRLTHLR